MGGQCVKMNSKSMINSHIERMDSIQNQLRRRQEKLHFTMTIEHLKLTNMTDKVKEIKFSLENEFEILFTLSEFTVQENLIKSQKIHKTQFKFPAKQLNRKRLLVELIGHKNQIIQTLNLKLIHLCTGPIHHDHLLKQLKARLMFDLNLYQTVNISSKCKNFKITLNSNGETQLSNISYRLTLTTSIDEKIFSTVQSCLISQEQKSFEECELYANISNNLIKQANFRIEIIRAADYFLDQMVKVIHTIFIPYRKIQNFQTYSTTRINDIDYVKKSLLFDEVLMEDQKVIGSLSFDLEVQSSTIYTQQMECLIFSEIGVSSVSPTISLQPHNDLIKQLKEIYKSVKKLKNTISQEKQALLNNLDKINAYIQKSNQEVFTCEEQLYERQITLVKLLNELSVFFSEGSDVLNERLWRIINYILHKPQLSTRYLTLHQNEKTKKQVYLKYYQFIIQVLTKIIICTQSGITYHELQCVQKFIAFAYFRFPWIQDKILQVLYRKQDPIISEEKLIQFGAHRGNKSPSKSYVYDWQVNIYRKIQSQKDFQVLLSKLQQIDKSHQGWDRLLFNRKQEDLFYGLYLEIWNQAEFTLKNIRGNILWQYFPNYGPLISCFLGEMNTSKISDFSSLFKLCSNKLVLNQKLLNTFVVQLFPKTYLLQISCVLKCLNLLQSYFQVLIKRNKKLPHDFHFNYFYTGVKSIIQQNHSYLIVKTLYILYKYYDIFTMDFKKILNNFLLCSKIFYQLFLHWCSNVRKMFHHLIYHKILDKQHKLTSNPQDTLTHKINQQKMFQTPKKNTYSKFQISIDYANQPMMSKSQKKSKTMIFSNCKELKQNFTEQALFDRKLHRFLRNIENQSNQLTKQKLSETKANKFIHYHQKMKLKLKQKKLKFQQYKKLQQDKYLSNNKFTLTEHNETQENQTIDFMIRKKSEFVQNDVQMQEFIKIRKMSATDQAYYEKVQPKYRNYCTISLKEYENVKKTTDSPNKEIQKLAKLVQGDIDS